MSTSWNDKNLKEVLTYITSIKDTPEVSFKKLLGEDTKQWKIKELVGAIGNLNFIYVVEGPKGSVLVKWVSDLSEMLMSRHLLM
jgi:5-methylthioribose kinase